jgi:hypothetical protein
VPADRLTAVLAAIASVGGDNDLSVLDRLCAAAVSLLSVTDAGISLMVDGQLRGTAGRSGPAVSRVQELQFELGEGPCPDAWSMREPVVEPDLAAPAVVRWPAFAAAAGPLGVASVFAFPLRLGAIRVGVLVGYRDRPGNLSADQLADGLALADVACWVILGLQSQAQEESLHELLAVEPPHWAQIHQATGIVSAQLEVPLEEALARLRAYAFVEGRPLREIAREIVSRQLRFEAAE